MKDTWKVSSQQKHDWIWRLKTNQVKRYLKGEIYTVHDIIKKYMVLKIKTMILDLCYSVKIHITNVKMHGDKLKKYRLM